ncbi:hypothetical protein RhiirC2_775663 [Rhizophagus irregularis]|uniref:Uncharacterized protein n=1 Tax=Rhizophagus irregularis TaxID=588596 RepID=A0A2N1NIS1_9GLOM|nr:hypothetical protein RhiirC2_775663 [Rhizophagus irregularis]
MRTFYDQEHNSFEIDRQLQIEIGERKMQLAEKKNRRALAEVEKLELEMQRIKKLNFGLINKIVVKLNTIGSSDKVKIINGKSESSKGKECK